MSKSDQSICIDDFQLSGCLRFMRLQNISPAQLLPRVSHLPHLILLESVTHTTDLGRYSFLMADPVDVVSVSSPTYLCDPFQQPRQWSQRWHHPRISGLPAFQGGIAGYLGYELGQSFEELPMPACAGLNLPTAIIGLYPWVIAWDHLTAEIWLLAHNDLTSSAQRRDLVELLNAPSTPSQSRNPVIDPSPCVLPEVCHPLTLLGETEVFGNFSRDQYLSAVQKVIDYIRAGDIFQANLSQQFWLRQPASLIELYASACHFNPAPFAAFYKHHDSGIVSSSPERFLQVDQGQVITRPIKGTRRRQHRPEADLFQRDELASSTKDRAENIMIVDLLRNDLSRVCQPDSIEVPKLCVVENYETVQHLVSEITGQLQTGLCVWDLLAATFPGGSITGAPKIRAMEIITELEGIARGPYCGAMFLHGWDGYFDSNILIRTLSVAQGWVQFPVGGGIVYHSDPAAEYQETLDKAAGLLRVFSESV